uniref:ADAMTS like 1 n=1 Tax=Latimeria chalumnae TaxID=7897 RepID=H3BDD4_LATCH
CSQSCGSGVQSREVLCKQRMADGSFLELPETFCTSNIPISQRTCEKEDCPPEWLPLEWSQCSASCGEGTQSRHVMCGKMLHDGNFITLSSSVCSGLPHPSLVRVCSVAPCARINRPTMRQGPYIVALRKVYIQSKRERKLQFIVGGYAYLLPKTSVVLRCPVRRFRKSLITWEKDGKQIFSSAHVTVTPYGYIKIHHLKPSDIGTYSCTAGSAQENFTIKLLGRNNKLIPHSSTTWNEEATKILKDSSSEGLDLKEKQLHGAPARGHKDSKQGLSISQSSKYDAIVLKLLEIKGLSREALDSREIQDSTERNVSSEEDQSMELSFPLTIITEQKRLDNIIRNLSQQTDELRELYFEQLVTQLALEISRSHLENNESNFKKTGSNSVRTPFHKPNLAFSGPPKILLKDLNLSSSTESGNIPSKPYKAPAILRKAHAGHSLSSPEVIADIGQTVLLNNWTLSLLLKCEAVGNPDPVIRWTKNGETLNYSNRTTLLPDRSLQILMPSESDLGFYSCVATNAFGSDSLSSPITLAGKPVIKAAGTDLISLTSGSLTVDVGSTLKAILGSSITIRCQAAGVPKAEISWFKDHVMLLGVHSALQDGSLLISNASLSDQGLYSCQAANLHGRATESTQLLMLDPPQADPELVDLTNILSAAGAGIHSVLTSVVGNTVLLNSGNTVLIACPVKGHPLPNITWFYNEQLISRVLEFKYRTLVGNQIIQIPNIGKDLQGEFSCLSQNEAGSLKQKTTLVILDYQWSMDGMLPCSVSCGNKGLQYPRLRCLLDNMEVDVAQCKERPKPTIQPAPCNRKDCPASWHLSLWTLICVSDIAKSNSQTVETTVIQINVKGFSNIVRINRVKKNVSHKNGKSKQLCHGWIFNYLAVYLQCNGQCIGPRMATQHREVFCQARNGTMVPSAQCSSLARPASAQNCSTDSCHTHWRIGYWTQCTATCGNYGFQSRRVECVHSHSRKALREQFCSWRPRPANWQRCNIVPCENKECRDTTRYCEKVKQLKLCQLSQFKVRCCESCRDV